MDKVGLSTYTTFYNILELWANFGPNTLFGAFRIRGAKKLHHKIQSFLDIFVTDRRTDGRKIIYGEIADRLFNTCLCN